MRQGIPANLDPLEETEKHWDTICLSTTTVATAAVAAVFFIMNLEPNRRSGSGAEELVGLILVGVATMALFVTGARSIRGVITPVQLRGSRDGADFRVGGVRTRPDLRDQTVVREHRVSVGSASTATITVNLAP